MRDQLIKPFSPSDIEWRVQQSGVSANGKPWCMVLAYVQARAIQERLDSVFGWDGWTDEYRNGNSDNNIICRLSVKHPKQPDKWISKENGASETHVEPFKGGISGAFKRVAASGFGIGRYLYNLEATFANTSTDSAMSKKDGWNKAKGKDGKCFYWQTPTLPDWALPIGQFKKQIFDITEPNEELFRDIVGKAEIELSKSDYNTFYKIAVNYWRSITAPTQ